MLRRVTAAVLGTCVAVTGLAALAGDETWIPVAPSVRGLLDPRGLATRNGDGETPLHEEARRGHPIVADLLLSRGADPNARDPWGWTPLHVAAAHGRSDVVEILLVRGADPRARDVWGQTPFELARVARHRRVQRILLAHHARP